MNRYNSCKEYELLQSDSVVTLVSEWEINNHFSLWI